MKVPWGLIAVGLIMIAGLLYVIHYHFDLLVSSVMYLLE